MVEVFARLTLVARVIGERSPSDWRRCGAGMNKPAAALKGYATAATTSAAARSSLRKRSEAAWGRQLRRTPGSWPATASLWNSFWIVWAAANSL